MSITATPDQLSALVDAAWQVLDDMRDGNCCCGLARSQLRIAFEPFRLQDDDLDLEFPLEPCLQMMRESH